MAETWGWTPDLGQWRMDRFGYSEQPSFISVSTDGVPAKASYDYWCDLAFSDFTPERSPTGAAGFKARAKGLSYHRADFFETQSSAISGGRAEKHIDSDGLGTISLGLVRSGRRLSTDRHGNQQLAKANEFFVYDARQRSQLQWSEHRASYIVLRRGDAEAALGQTIPDVDELTRRLSVAPMRHLVGDQLNRVAQYHEHLGIEAQCFLIEQTIQLALFALAERSDNDQPLIEDNTLFHTALRYVSTNLADPLLDAERVARALGVSRATLYRAFLVRDIGVAEAIRDLRLDRARNLLERAPHLGIAEIAQHCGLYDTPNFSRLFRRRFGITPSEVRKSNR